MLYCIVNVLCINYVDVIVYLMCNCGPLWNYVVRYQATFVIHALDLWEVRWFVSSVDSIKTLRRLCAPLFRVVLCDNFLPGKNFLNNWRLKMYSFSSALIIYVQRVYAGGLLLLCSILCPYPSRFVRFASLYKWKVTEDWLLTLPKVGQDIKFHNQR